MGDAAVVGSVFWAGALSTMGASEPRELEDSLSGLLERQLIRRIRESSLEGEREFAFVHALAREVAYGQLPRGARARKHAAVASWLEAIAGTRLEDLAEVIAHHCVTALELARATRQDELADSLADQAVRYLTLAGDRGFQVDVASAVRDYGRALGLLEAKHPARPLLLQKRAEALFWLGDYQRAADTVAEAVTGFASGRRPLPARRPEGIHALRRGAGRLGSRRPIARARRRP
jgi:hypothetical protein